jgi:DNA-binding response OmpR family regulator
MVLNILVVEDYDVLRNAMVKVLTRAGHRVLGVGMAEDVDDEPMGCLPDMYIIDLNLPGENGLSLVRRIRQSAPKTHIVLATARTNVDDKVAGYSAGADIYMPKPVAPEELVAIAQSVAMRLQQQVERQPSHLALHGNRMLLTGPLGQVQLTQSEVLMLGALARAPNAVLEYWQVAQHLGGDSKDSQEVRVGRLRKKLVACGAEAPAIRAIRNQGYKLVCPVEVLVD